MCKLLVQKGGGKSGVNARSCHPSLPSAWSRFLFAAVKTPWAGCGELRVNLLYHAGWVYLPVCKGGRGKKRLPSAGYKKCILMAKMFISVSYKSEVLAQERFLWLLNSADPLSWTKATEWHGAFWLQGVCWKWELLEVLFTLFKMDS